MTPAEFKKKWSRYSGKETSAYQGHFDDLCRLLEQPTPAEADPSGSDFFCFQKRVVKDAELFVLRETGVEAEPGERGFADVWRKGCFAWEYKGKKKNLDEASKQLHRYRESLLNPPLLVVCDFDRLSSARISTARSRKSTNSTTTRLTGPKTCGFSAPCLTIPISSNRSARLRRSPKNSPNKSPKLAARCKAARAWNWRTPGRARNSALLKRKISV
jgi:hypothetical protein